MMLLHQLSGFEFSNLTLMIGVLVSTAMLRMTGINPGWYFSCCFFNPGRSQLDMVGFNIANHQHRYRFALQALLQPYLLGPPTTVHYGRYVSCDHDRDRHPHAALSADSAKRL